MSSDSESNSNRRQRDSPLSNGTKRNHESLFVSSDEVESDEAHDSAKRLKLSETSPKHHTIDIGNIAPYDADKAEVRPHLAIYHPSFSEAEALATQICDGFIQAHKKVKEDGYDNEEMDKIVQSLWRWRDPVKEYPGVKPVSFLGPAGTGKSSAVTCYLNQLGAAVESDSGARGTHVVHEYSRARPDQSALFLVAVQYKRPIQIKRLTEKHCKNIYAFKNLGRTEELDEEEMKLLKEKHDTALDFFVTLLREQEEFETEEDASEYFEERKADMQTAVVDELLEFIRALLDAKNISNNEEVFTAESEEELNSIFQRISGPTIAGGALGRKSALWPLMVKVQVHQDKDLLNAGVILGDTPGVNDTNRTVVQNAKSYLKGAGTVLVFATPSRIQKNHELDTNLCECIRDNKMHCTYLVVTMIDNKSTFKPSDKASLSPEDKEELEVAEAHVERLKAELAGLSQAKESTDDLDEFKRLDHIMKQRKATQKAATMKVKQVTIQIRNRQIEQALKGKLRELSGSKRAPDLKMFFTSNSEYQKHLSGYDVDDPPVLDIPATGIPGVTRLLYEVPAYGKINTLSVIVRKRIPQAFNGIMGVLTKSPLERKKDVEKLIRRVLDEEQLLMDQILRDLRNTFDDRVDGGIRSNEEKWKKSAEAKLKEWQDYNVHTFHAFCRHKGIHKPQKATSYLSWNSEIKEIFAVKLNGVYNGIDDDIDTIETDAITSICNLYQMLQEELEGCEEFNSPEEKAFFQYIHQTKDRIITDITKCFDKLKEHMGFIRSATTLKSERKGDTCYVSACMQQTYDDCQLISTSNFGHAPAVTYLTKKGKLRRRSGPHAARVEIVRKRLSGDGDVVSIFAAVANNASSDYAEYLEKWAEECRKKISNGSKRVLDDFNGRFDAPEVKAEVKEEHLMILQEAAEKGQALIQGELAEKLEAAEAYQKFG